MGQAVRLIQCGESGAFKIQNEQEEQFASVIVSNADDMGQCQRIFSGNSGRHSPINHHPAPFVIRHSPQLSHVSTLLESDEFSHCAWIQSEDDD
jgi:hypothetical protein